jgi:heterodisulfide reductase subunit C
LEDKEAIMAEDAIKLGRQKKSLFIDKIMVILPEGGNLDLCLTCETCSSGCPASGPEDMDPQRLLRMAALGLDDEILKSDWVWMCTMCQRCLCACPMSLDSFPNTKLKAVVKIYLKL